MKNWIINFFRQKRLKTFRLSSIVETVIFIVVAIGVNKIFFPSHHGFLNVHPHPFWVIVILIAIRYGFKEGLVCAGVAGATYSAFVLFPTCTCFDLKSQIMTTKKMAIVTASE